MWMSSARSATIGKKQLDGLVSRIAALPEPEQRRIHDALDALDRRAVDPDGLDAARADADTALAGFMTDGEGSGLPPAAAAFRDGALAVLQARARLIGAEIAARGASADAVRLVGACEERALGADRYDLKVEAAIGLGPLAPAALRGE
jgi:hypothetical protein